MIINLKPTALKEKIGETNFDVDWCIYFFNIARCVARKSKDPSTKIGVVTVDKDLSICSTGYNNFPRKVKDLESRYNNRNLKYNFILHAEVASILEAARKGISLKDCTLIVPNWGAYTCHECAKAVIGSGIKTIIGENKEIFAGGRWQNSIEIANQMYDEAGVVQYNLDLSLICY